MDIAIESLHGEFDLVEIESKLLAMPNVAPYPSQVRRLMLAPDAETLENSLENRKLEHPRRDFSVALVALSPHRILLSFRDDRLHAPRAFVTWLRKHQPVKILDEEFDDLGPQLDPSLDLIFGPEP